MATSFKSKGALAGERLCARLPRRAINRSAILYYEAAAISVSLSATAIINRILFVMALIRVLFLTTTLRARLSIDFPASASAWWLSRAPLPQRRTVALLIEPRTIAAPAGPINVIVPKGRALSLVPEIRIAKLPVEIRRIAVPPERVTPAIPAQIAVAA